MPSSDADFALFSGARCLVLGAEGFVGRWVARKLTAAGAELALHVLDADRARPIFERWQVQGELHAADLLPQGRIAALLQSTRPALVFNLIGYGIDPAQREEELAWRLNSDLVRELVEALAKSPAPHEWQGLRLVHTGSAAEYGASGGDLDEGRECKPTTMYGRTKLRGTLQLVARCDLLGLRAVSARLFTLYGPGELAGRLLPTLLAAGRNGGDVELSAGTQKRDFTYVEEAAEGLVRLALSGIEEPQPINLATGVLTSVRGFAQAAAAALGLPQDRLRFGAKPPSEHEMEHEAPTLARLRRSTGWTPELSIAAGVARARAFEVERPL